MNAWIATSVAFAAVFAASCVLTAVVRRYAAARMMVDVPNARSSHCVPVPRGGGLAVVIAFAGGLLGLAVLGVVEWRLAAALLAGGAPVAVAGWLDDVHDVPPRWRAAVHLCAAGAATWVLGGLPALQVGSADIPLGRVGAFVGVLGVVWATNLFNFMDGIDGIAGAQALSVGLAAGALLAWTGQQGLAAAALMLAAASAGFLVWNWQPARIFMGDVGSNSLGFWFAALALASENAGALPLVVWGMLMGVFVVDATVTLVRRLVRGERPCDPHREHAYQRAVRAGLSHAYVSGAVVLLNGVLAAAALVMVLRPQWVLPALAGAAALLGRVYLGVERRYPMRGGANAVRSTAAPRGATGGQRSV